MNRLALAVLLSLMPGAVARAQVSDDPFIISAGRTQVEIDFIHTRDNDAGARTDAFDVAPVLITHGLTSRADLGLGFGGYHHERTHAAGATRTVRGWGDLVVRAKYSLHGHDNPSPAPGDTALALLPYVTVPLKSGGGSDLVLGGLILPVAVTLPGDWSVIVMSELDAVADATDRHRKGQWIESLVLARAFSETISSYVEFYSVCPFERGVSSQAYANFGVTYAFSADFQIDAGSNFGLTRSSSDVQPFIKLTLCY